MALFFLFGNHHSSKSRRRARANRRGPPIVTIASEGTASSCSTFIPCLTSSTSLLQVFQSTARTSIASEQLNQTEWTRECALTSRMEGQLWSKFTIKFTTSFGNQCNLIINLTFTNHDHTGFFLSSGCYRNYRGGDFFLIWNPKRQGFAKYFLLKE